MRPRLLRAFSLVVLGGFLLLIATEVRKSDGLWIACLTVFLGVGGNLAVYYFGEWRDGKSKTGYAIPIVAVLIIALVLAGWETQRSVTNHQTLTEQNRVFRRAFSILAADYFAVQNIASKEKPAMQERWSEFSDWIESGHEVGDIVDDPDFYLGLASYKLGNEDSALQHLRSYLEMQNSYRSGPREALGLYAEASILAQQGHRAVGATACSKLVEGFSAIRAATSNASDPRYLVARNELAHDILNRNCAIDRDLFELKQFAKAVPGMTFVPEPEVNRVLSRKYWRLISWSRKTHTAVYELPLGGIMKPSGLESIIIEILSPHNQISRIYPDSPSSALRPAEQEPFIKANTPERYVLVFPNFDPSLGWYLIVRLTNLHGAQQQLPDLRATMGFIRFP